MITYTAISAFLFLALSFVWSKNNWANLIIKFAFFALSLWGGFLWFESLGFIVQVVK